MKKRMRPGAFPTSLIIAFSAFIFQSCCKSYCSDETIFAVDFVGFTASEMEKIKILTYNSNDIAVAIDSYYVSTNNIIKKDTSRVYPDKPLRSEFSFKILVETPGLSYHLRDVQTKKEDCNCGSGTYKAITGYTLNGVQHRYPINPLVIKM